MYKRLNYRSSLRHEAILELKHQSLLFLLYKTNLKIRTNSELNVLVHTASFVIKVVIRVVVH